MTSMADAESMRSVIDFSLLSMPLISGPRLGQLLVKKSSTAEIELETPNFLASTSRGTVPHLTPDNLRKLSTAKMIHVPFESFLERMPPAPTLVDASRPLERFLNIEPNRHIVSMSLRDPLDIREMPSNGNKFISAHCIRGVRKVTPDHYRSYVEKCNPDIIIALSDTPFTPPPFSQRRIARSLERSQGWLSTLLAPTSQPYESAHLKHHTYNIFMTMAGDIDENAREAFATSLKERLHGKDAEAVKPFACLDDGILGYSFDLLPLRASILASSKTLDDLAPLTDPNTIFLFPRITSLLHSSFRPLSPTKPRLATGAASPHEILLLIRDVGVDVFDVAWAQKAADWGIALDFTFPAPYSEGRLLDIGHNLYGARHEMDFTKLADEFLDAYSATNGEGAAEKPICYCIACSPSPPSSSSIELSHAAVDRQYESSPIADSFDAPHTRAYIHHLLHTHEMSAHTLLAAHNLSVAEMFFASIRKFLSRSLHLSSQQDVQEGSEPDLASFNKEIERFLETYDSTLGVFGEAKEAWVMVERARGKGRLAREKEKLGEEALVTKVEVAAVTDEDDRN